MEQRTMKTIRFPSEILEQMQPLITKRNLTFSNFVLEAIKNYIRMLNFQEKIDSSFGAWDESRHPELKEGVDRYVRNMRKGRA